MVPERQYFEKIMKKRHYKKLVYLIAILQIHFVTFSQNYKIVETGVKYYHNNETDIPYSTSSGALFCEHFPGVNLCSIIH